MSTLIRDMSQIGPAPTLRRETAVLAVTTVVVLVVFGTLIAATDRPPFLYGAIGAALFAFGVIRWIVACEETWPNSSGRAAPDDGQNDPNPRAHVAHSARPGRRRRIPCGVRNRSPAGLPHEVFTANSNRERC